jgi:hypothetical protein
MRAKDFGRNETVSRALAAPANSTVSTSNILVIIAEGTSAGFPRQLDRIPLDQTVRKTVYGDCAEECPTSAGKRSLNAPDVTARFPCMS